MCVAVRVWLCGCVVVRLVLCLSYLGCHSKVWRRAVGNRGGVVFVVPCVPCMSLCAVQLMRYPFLPDFHAATLVKSGSSLRDAM